MRQHFIKHGIVDDYSQRESQKGLIGFHLERWLKRALQAFNVAFVDNCCFDETAARPMRYNPVDGTFEAFDGTEWVVVGAGTPPLPTPTAFAGTAGDGESVLTWNASAGATNYVVKKNGVQIYSGPLLTFTATGLTNGVDYTFTVIAEAAGVPDSVAATIVVTPAAPSTPQLATPTNFNGTTDDSHSVLTWDAVVNATNYVVTQNSVQIYSGPLLTFDATGLTNGTTYTFTVIAEASGFTDSNPATTIETPVAPPIEVEWMSTPTDPHGDLSTNVDSFIYTGSASLASTSSNIVIDVSDAIAYPDNNFVVVRVPATVTDKTLWADDPTNAPFNNGAIPDSNFRAMVTFGGFDYYYSRVGMIFDHTPTSRVTLS